MWDRYESKVWDQDDTAGTHYTASLGNLDRADYINKLVLSSGEKWPDPYAIADHEWVLDMSKWPPIIWQIHLSHREAQCLYKGKSACIQVLRCILLCSLWPCARGKILNILQPSSATPGHISGSTKNAVKVAAFCPLVAHASLWWCCTEIHLLVSTVASQQEGPGFNNWLW